MKALSYRRVHIILIVFTCVGIALGIIFPVSIVTYAAATHSSATVASTPIASEAFFSVGTTRDNEKSAEPFYDVPFYSQFTDISSARWQKVGCGIASVAMLIDFYSTESVNVDALLQAGIEAGAYLDDAGWTHAGLIALSHPFGLDGASQSLAHLTDAAALAALRTEVTSGPVMVSVHYTFQPTNPIPHLAVVTGIDKERVYYNDPAEPTGENSISIEQFQLAWKKRFIAIRPV